MTLARTALRLATVAALKGDVSGRPTIAEGRVYDSRFSDFAPETFADDAKPTILVLTDSDEGEALSRQNGGPPFTRLIDLVLELGIVQTIQDGDDFVVGYPDTDARHEASLDALEYQIMRRLGYDPAPLAVLWRSFVRPRKHDCHRQVLDDSGVKIACRILTLTCEVSDDQVTVFNTDGDVPSGLDALPEPLRRVAQAMPDGSSGASIVAAIAAAIAPPLSIGPLDGVDITVANADGMDVADMLDVSVEIRNAIDMPQIVAASGAVTLDYAKGTFQNLILAANVTSLLVINWPKNGKTGRLILKITNTGDFALGGWPNTEWVGGIAPTITQGAGKKDIVVLTTASAGAEVFGNIVGQDYR
jgi:hypothetical protein